MDQRWCLYRLEPRNGRMANNQSAKQRPQWLKVHLVREEADREEEAALPWVWDRASADKVAISDRQEVAMVAVAGLMHFQGHSQETMIKMN